MNVKVMLLRAPPGGGIRGTGGIRSTGGIRGTGRGGGTGGPVPGRARGTRAGAPRPHLRT